MTESGIELDLYKTLPLSKPTAEAQKRREKPQEKQKNQREHLQSKVSRNLLFFVLLLLRFFSAFLRLCGGFPVTAHLPPSTLRAQRCHYPRTPQPGRPRSP